MTEFYKNAKECSQTERGNAKVLLNNAFSRCTIMQYQISRDFYTWWSEKENMNMKFFLR